MVNIDSITYTLGRSLDEAFFSGTNLRRMDFNPAGHLDNGLLPLERSQGHFGLEG